MEVTMHITGERFEKHPPETRFFSVENQMTISTLNGLDSVSAQSIVLPACESNF